MLEAGTPTSSAVGAKNDERFQRENEVQVKAYLRNHSVSVVETTALSANGFGGVAAPDVETGPGATAYWRDELDVENWQTGGLVLRRAYGLWGEPGEWRRARRDSEGEAVSYTLFSARELCEDVAEVYVDGFSLLSLDGEGTLGFTDDIIDNRESE